MADLHATSHSVAESDALLRRWNIAASSVGYAGSEFHNEPEAVFKRVRELQAKYRKARIELARRSGCA